MAEVQTGPTETWRSVERLSKAQKASQLQLLLGKAAQYTNFLSKKLNQDTNTKNVDGADRKRLKISKNESVACSGTTGVRFKQPSNLTGGKLRDYQLEGTQWLISLYENGLHGILADEMGLGKTIQVVALMAHLREMDVKGAMMVVAPLSTLTNWKREFEKWAPSIDVCLYHGSRDERRALQQTRLNARTHNAVHPIVVTSYEIVMRDRALFGSRSWKYIVVDEGHRLKNMNCKLVKELKRYDSANRLLLTGTPLQNNLMELWSLLNFLLPAIFNDLEAFQKWFDFADHMASKEGSEAMLEQEMSQCIVTKLHQVLQPFLLRRLKVDVLRELKPKHEIILYAALTEHQKAYYAAIQRGKLAELLKQAGGAGRVSFRNKLMQLRKCCNHPFLFDTAAAEPDALTTDESIVQASGKMALMDTILQEMHKQGRKVLVFSQMTRLLDILEDYLIMRSWQYHRIDGGVGWKERQAMMDDFNDKGSDAFVFLLSTRAGGLGINLTAADTVIIYDSDWNPHQDSQAQDRCHRMGQKNIVMVYRLVTANSIELRVLERANAKRKLERVVVSHKRFKSAQAKKSVLCQSELAQLLKDDVDIAAASKEECSGISADSLRKVLDRQSVQSLPKKGNGYEIVEHTASSLIGHVS